LIFDEAIALYPRNRFHDPGIPRPATEAAQQSIASLGTPGRGVSEAFAFIVELDLPRRLADVGVTEDR
jgi:hypothetical protein